MEKTSSIEEPQALSMIVIFDGECALCSHWVRWSADQLVLPTEVCWVPSQTEAGQSLLRSHGIESTPDTLVVLFPEYFLTRSAAVFAILLAMHYPYPALSRCFSWIPAPIRDAGYRVVAAIRRRIGPRVDRCELEPSTKIRMEITDLNNIPWKVT